MVLSNNATSVIVRATELLEKPKHILLTSELAGTDLRLIRTAISNTSYRLEFNPDLNPTNWNALAGDVTGLSNTTSKPDALTSSNRFYRVRVLP